MRISDSNFRNQRLHERKTKIEGDDRSPAQRDRDRLLYSSALRRLAEVTQVVAADSGYVFHNRLTHSLQVAQVGRRLAEKLFKRLPQITGDVEFEGLDPDVVEAARLAHDLGHPPFGHIAEEALDKLAASYGGFEGNAQSFRILTRLAFRSADYRGLDLTRATLAAVLKYPWFKGENPAKPEKFGAYESERRDFEFARELYPNNNAQTLEAALMDWADDITYSIHDLEDFYRAGRMPLHLLGNRDPSERQYFFNDLFERRYAQNAQVARRRSDLEEAFTDTLVSTFPSMRAYSGSEEQRIGLRNFTGTLIGRYINGVDLLEKDGRLCARVKPEYQDEVFMFKQLTWTYVIEAPSLATQQWGLKQKIGRLFSVYTEAAASSKEWKLFPVYYQERLKRAAGDGNELVRVCIDLIASMTENQVHKIFGRLTGSSSGGSLEDPLQ